MWPKCWTNHRQTPLTFTRRSRATFTRTTVGLSINGLGTNSRRRQRRNSAGLTEPTDLTKRTWTRAGPSVDLGRHRLITSLSSMWARRLGWKVETNCWTEQGAALFRLTSCAQGKIRKGFGIWMGAPEE